MLQWTVGTMSRIELHSIVPKYYIDIHIYFIYNEGCLFYTHTRTRHTHYT